MQELKRALFLEFLAKGLEQEYVESERSYLRSSIKNGEKQVKRLLHVLIISKNTWYQIKYYPAIRAWVKEKWK